MVARLHHQCALVVAAFLLSTITALGTNYEHDGQTTYCWAIPRRTNETKLTEQDRTPEFVGKENCPMEMTVTLNTTTIQPQTAINVTWTVVASFVGDAINNTKLAYGKDAKGGTAQIVHSNVHSCVYGTGCDPFNDGKELVDKTVNKIANFTDGKTEFHDTLQFPSTGEYSVLAHIILPSDNASQRFDYAVYTRVVVAAKSDRPTPPVTPVTAIPTSAPISSEETRSKSGSGGISQEATVGIVVGGIVVVVALVVLAVIYYRRKDNTGYAPAPTIDGGVVGAREAKDHPRTTGGKSNADGSSAWGESSERGLDNTSHSNTSAQRYAAASLSEPGLDGSRGTSTWNPRDFSSSINSASTTTTAARKKRVDSDVEL